MTGGTGAARRKADADAADRAEVALFFHLLGAVRVPRRRRAPATLAGNQGAAGVDVDFSSVLGLLHTIARRRTYRTTKLSEPGNTGSASDCLTKP
jgi:hypothetical protein